MHSGLWIVENLLIHADFNLVLFLDHVNALLGVLLEELEDFGTILKPI